MDKNGLIAIFLIVMIWTVYSMVQKPPASVEEPVPSQSEQILDADAVSGSPSSTTPALGSPGKSPALRATEKINREVLRTLENDSLKLMLSSKQANFVEIRLKHFFEEKKPDAPSVNLVRKEAGLHSFALILGDSLNEHISRQGFEEVDFNEEENRVSYRFRLENNLQIERSFQLVSQTYDVFVQTRITNLSTQETLQEQPGLIWSQSTADLSKGSGFFRMFGAPPNISQSFAFLGNNHFESLKVKPGERKDISGQFFWAALADRYFLLAVFPQWDGNSKLETTYHEGTNGPQMVNRLFSREVDLAPGGSTDFNLKLFLGPKQLKILEDHGNQLNRALDFGFFHVFAIFLLKLMQIFHGFLKNWGLSIILLTVLAKIVLFPLTHKMFKSMKEMQRIQPLIKEMQERYKDDREQLNLQMLKLMREHKVNPLGGCFPMIVQMPIWIALYRVLYSAIELRHAPFFLWIQDLSARDPYFITPVFLGVTMFIQQKLSPKPPDPMQAKMMMFMPLMFSAIMLFLPSGLVIYIFCNTLLSILQQWYINKSFKKEVPLPQLVKS